MFFVFIQFESRPTPLEWDTISGWVSLSDAMGIEEETSSPSGSESLHTANEFAEAIAPGVLESPIYFKAFYPSLAAAESAHQFLKEKITLNIKESYIQQEPDQDYEALAKANFVPSFVPPFWRIAASWHNLEENPGEKIIRIEPGMAFGTGSHDTTQHCLELGTKVITDKTLNVLDFGCGSGILAISAKLLGAKNSIGVDIDPLAIEASKYNAEMNHVSIFTSLELPSSQAVFDVVFANILKNTLIEFLPYFKIWLKPSGHIIVSGILNEQRQEISEVFSASNFKEVTHLQSNEWTTLLFQKI